MPRSYLLPFLSYLMKTKRDVKLPPPPTQIRVKDCQNDMTGTWQILKEIAEKIKLNSKRFPKSINVNGKAIKKNSHVVEEFSRYLFQCRIKSGQKDTKHI